jgi:superfamily II DNA or RNA helicase
MKDKVLIEFSFIWCKIKTTNIYKVDSLLYNSLCYRPEGYFYSPKYQDGRWDGFCRLYKPKTRRFRTGLLPRVIQILEDNGFEVQILNFPNHVDANIRKIQYKNGQGEDITLRHYQQDAVKTALIKRFGIIQAPPRSGKTLIATSIIDHFNQFPAIFFVRSKDLAYQTLRVFSNNFPDKKIGFICDGDCKIGDVNIVTIQSAYSAFNKKYEEKGRFYKEKDITDKESVKKILKDAKIIFLDEVHHLQSSTSGFIYDRCTSTQMKIGLSATPFSDKPDSILVEERTGPVIYKITYSSLIEEGYLMTPHIYVYKLPKITNTQGNYRAIYNKAVVENEFLVLLVKKLAKELTSLGKSVVVQTEFIQHTKNLAKVLNCEYLVGSDSAEKRQNLMKKLYNKDILVLVSTLFEEGIDIPSLDYTINLVGGLSNIATFQRMRSITKHESKTFIGIIDFFHQAKYLERHSKKRLSLYKDEPSFVVEIRDVSSYTIQDLLDED